MSVVWKYEIAIEDEQVLEMPRGAELLHIGQQQPGSLVLWARVIPTGQPIERRVIIVRGTGHPIWTQPYVGTVQDAVGLVWHIFDGGVDDEFDGGVDDESRSPELRGSVNAGRSD